MKVKICSMKESKSLKEWFSEKDFKAMGASEQEQYLKDHPNSKFQPDKGGSKDTKNTEVNDKKVNKSTSKSINKKADKNKINPKYVVNSLDQAMSIDYEKLYKYDLSSLYNQMDPKDVEDIKYYEKRKETRKKIRNIIDSFNKLKLWDKLDETGVDYGMNSRPNEQDISTVKELINKYTPVEDLSDEAVKFFIQNPTYRSGAYGPSDTEHVNYVKSVALDHLKDKQGNN